MPRRANARRLPLIAWLEARPRWQRTVALVIVGLAVAWWIVQRAAGLLLDKWWFHSVTPSPVWATRLTAQAWTVGIAGTVTALLIGSTVLVVLRSRMPDEEMPSYIVRHHQRFGPAHSWLLVGLGALVVWKAMVGATNRWQEWLLFWNARDLNAPVPELGRDLGYYLYRLPLLGVASSWLRLVLVLCLVLAIVGHGFAGSLALPGSKRRSSPVVPLHLGLLVVGLVAVQALHYTFVSRGQLAVDRSGSFDGPGYVQLTITSPGLWVLAGAAIVTGAMIVVAMRRGRWRWPLVAGGLWLALHVVIVLVLPGIVQALVVNPAEAQREMPYLAHNLDATKRAYRLDVVQQDEVTLDDGLTTQPTQQQLDELDRVPVFDRSQLVSSFQVLVGTTATRITDIDLDRYALPDTGDEERRAVLIAARNASRADLPENGWVQERLVYTHGNGVVVAPADRPAPDGRPDLSSASALTPVKPELYFGEGLSNWYVLVDTKRPEQDGAQFDAGTGIPIDTLWKRLVLSLSVGESQPLLSTELGPDAELLLYRGLTERLNKLAPWLSWDGNPYPAVVDDRIVWVVDGYTTSSTFPYAQFASNAGVPSSSDLSGSSYNYLHGSVKATVDAYSGDVHLYRTEVGGADDPVLDAWASVFPDLIEPIADMPETLRAHLRYPADLFTVQSDMLGRYHVDTPELLFAGTQRWSLSPATPTSVGDQPSGVSDEVDYFAPDGEQDAGAWVAVRTFVPGASSNPSSARFGLAAYTIANHDDFEQVRLVEVTSSTDQLVTSAQVAQSAIDADPDLARDFTFLNSNGSKVTFGPMTMVTLGDAVVWLRPIIVNGTSDTSTPHLYKVVVVNGGTVGSGATASEALLDALAG